MLCAAPRLTTREGRIIAGAKMRTLSATVVLKEGLAWYVRCRTSAAARRASASRV